VRTGASRAFSNRDISVDAVLAASCLPTVCQAVEVEGEFYWDGAYSDQSTIAPLLGRTACRDVLLGQISPIGTREVPRRAADIQSRINDIALHSSARREAAALAAIASIDDEWIKPEYRDRISLVRLHGIRSADFLSDLTLASRFDTSWRFLSRMRDMGRLATELWLDANFEQIGVSSTIHLHSIQGSLPC
jgi:NTE family protein